jgi:hypothetical protein
MVSPVWFLSKGCGLRDLFHGCGKKGRGRRVHVLVQRDLLYLEDYEPRHLKSQDEAPISVKTQGSFTPSGSRSSNWATWGMRAAEVWSG